MTLLIIWNVLLTVYVVVMFGRNMVHKQALRVSNDSVDRRITILTDELRLLESTLGYSYVKNSCASHKFITGEERDVYIKKKSREYELMGGVYPYKSYPSV